jgi:hypothetical protein
VAQLNTEFAERDGHEHLPELRKTVDFQLYTDPELNFEQRMAESGIYDLWTKHELINLPGGAGSELNQFMAAALQGTEYHAGFDTVIWDYGTPGHGLVGAIESPTRDPAKINQQETYVLETDDRATAERRIQTWEDSPYRTGDGIAPHPANPDIDDAGNMYIEVSGYNSEEEEFNLVVRDNDELVGRFEQLYRQPDTEPAYDLLDPIATAEYVDDHIGGRVHLSEGEITIFN